MVAIRSFVVALLLAFGGTVALAAQPATDRVTIVRSSGEHAFGVEVMRSREELEQGLMFRRELARDRGMLFDFGQAQPVSMWMKNTYLPLDMVFIGADGHIVSIKEDAKPMSETVIPSGGLVLGVLEVNAGTARRIGLKLGDVVRHPTFGN